MKQRFTKLLAAVALLVGLTIPMGMWGQTRAEEVYSTCRFGSSYNPNNSSYTGTFTVTNGNFTWTVGNGNNNNNGWTNGSGFGQVKFGRKDVASVGYITTNGAYNQAITKVDLTIDALTASKINSITLYTSTDNSNWNSAGTFTKAAGKQTVSINTPIADLYYKIEFDCASGSSNGLITISKVEYYHNAGVSYTIIAQSNNTAYGSVSLSGSVITGTPADGCRYANPAYTVDPTNSATVAQEGNEFTVTPSANTTVTINFEAIPTHIVTLPENDTYGTYTMNATNPVAYGTNVTLTYTPATGYEAYAATWSLNGTPINGNMFTMPDEDVTVSVALAEATAEFVNGVYTETMTTQASFDNWRSYSVSGDQCWEFGGSSYGAKISGYVNPTNYENEDWYISPKMQVDNGKLDISFACVGRYGEAGMITILYSTNFTGVPSAAIWTEITPDQSIPYNASNWNFQNITCNIEQTGNVYFAFKYVSTTEKAGTFEVKNFTAKQYYNVIFDANDENATGTMAPLSCVAGVAKALTENAFEVSGKVFNGWNTQSDGSGNTYADGANISITQNTTLYAQWADVYAVSFMANGNLVDTKNVKQGDPIGTLPTVSASYIPEGYEFMGWFDGDYSSENTAPDFILATYEPTGDITLKAVFAQVTSSGSSTGTLTGDEIASEFADPAQAYSDDERTYVDGDFTWVTKCQTNTDRHWIQLRKNNVPSYVKIIAPSDIRNVVVTITSASNSSGGIDDISMHQGFSTSGEIYLNTEANGNTHVGVTSGSTIENNMATIIPSGDHQTLFLQVSTGARIWNIAVTCGSVSYSNYCTSVTEPIELPITGYNNGGGWNLIASPVVSIDPVSAGMITDTYGSTDVTPENGTYDLYRFNQSAELEWENYRVHSFALESGKGYLYASKDGVSIQFAGAPYNSNGEIPLVYDAGKDFAGWNLIGNPFGVAATLDIPYYRMNENQTTLGAKIEGGQIEAMEGVFVYAYDADEQQAITKATFTRAGRSNNAPQGFVNLNVEQNASVVDNVIVRFDEGRSLPKLQLFKGSAEIFITKNGKDYAIVNSEAQGEMPVNFKAQKNGTYTLNIDTENVEMNYLHLIDNMTGMDVDLLQTPSYTFDATTNDYASRFRLVFSANNEDGPSTGSEAFAFYSNGNWVVGNEGEATLQVIDVNGRIVSNEIINGTVATSINATPGVYMLRLVNGNEVKTQKIVVR